MSSDTATTYIPTGWDGTKPRRQTIAAGARRLDRAAEIIETKGWVRGTLAVNDDEGDMWGVDPTDKCATRFCASGAIILACHKDRNGEMADHTPIGVAMRALDALTLKDYGHDSFVVWNDEQAKNKRQVAQAMRRAAKRLRAEAGLAKPAVAA